MRTRRITIAITERGKYMTALLQRFFQVRKGEGAAVFASALSFFFILTALMVIRPARESLGMRRGIEAVRWLFIGTAVVTLAVNPIFALLVSRYRRIVFITATYVFFALSLVGFYLVLVGAPRAIGEVSGMVFFVWFSVFNLFSTMVFWALMADRFSLEQSKRLFGVISVGGTLGAIAGPWLASKLAHPLGTAGLLPVAATLLALAVVAAWIVTRIQTRSADATADSGAPREVDDRAIIGGSAWEGFRAALRSPYLLGISAYVLILTVISTFIYFTRLQMVAALGSDVDMRTSVFARIDFYTQVTTLVLQALVTGQLMKRLGVHITLALLPAMVSFGFVGLAMSASLGALIVLQAAFSAMQRAIVRPARETLFTVVPREDKYKSKAFIDTFVYRVGDVVGSQLEGVLRGLAMGLSALVAVTVPLAIVWGVLGVWLGRAQQQRVADGSRPRRAPRGEEAVAV
ncbi:MAG TPA: MFS transporter [Gemmatimonadaceae bacterium]|nr:MFS transporter [Gemmatimonadaceae bacterium]